MSTRPGKEELNHIMLGSARLPRICALCSIFLFDSSGSTFIQVTDSGALLLRTQRGKLWSRQTAYDAKHRSQYVYFDLRGNYGLD